MPLEGQVGTGASASSSARLPRGLRNQVPCAPVVGTAHGPGLPELSWAPGLLPLFRAATPTGLKHGPFPLCWYCAMPSWGIRRVSTGGQRREQHLRAPRKAAKQPGRAPCGGVAEGEVRRKQHSEETPGLDLRRRRVGRQQAGWLSATYRGPSPLQLTPGFPIQRGLSARGPSQAWP